MAFTVHDVRDLTHFLTLHPEWLAEVRRLVLTDELLTLPALVRELTQAQTRAEERLMRLETTVAELAQAQKRTEERVERLAATVQELAQAQQRVEQQLTELAAAQRRTEQSVLTLADTQKRMENTLSRLVGDNLERRYRERAGTPLGVSASGSSPSRSYRRMICARRWKRA